MKKPKKIFEIKNTLDGQQQTFRCELLQQNPAQCVLQYTLQQPLQLHGVDLPTNTITIAYFWKDKPYNLYHFISNQNSDSVTLAYYFNICDRTEWQHDSVTWRDLTVDILVIPNQDPIVLDREQLPGNLPCELNQYIKLATEEVLHEHQREITKAKLQSTAWLKRTSDLLI